MPRARRRPDRPASGRPHGSAAADLARAQVDRARPEHVVAGAIVLEEFDLERAARGPGDPSPREDQVPVVPDPHAPRFADPVLVDLVLDLDPAVLLAELELPV